MLDRAAASKTYAAPVALALGDPTAYNKWFGHSCNCTHGWARKGHYEGCGNNGMSEKARNYEAGAFWDPAKHQRDWKHVRLDELEANREHDDATACNNNGVNNQTGNTSKV